jgi:hypothetical protein
MLKARPGDICAKRDCIGPGAVVAARVVAAGICLSLVTAGAAQAASRSIRLSAYVPVFCALKAVAPYSNMLDKRGAYGTGTFKVVCNTPYNMHMGGTWDPPGWPHLDPGGHDRDGHGGHAAKDLDVELRVTGKDGTKQALCAFSSGRQMNCRTLADDDGRGPSPLAQAEVSIGRSSPSTAGAAPQTSSMHPFSLFEPSAEHAPQWGGRMSLGGLPHVASAGELPYLPSFVTEIAKNSGAARGSVVNDDGMGLPESNDEQITLFLTLTGKY